MIDPPAGAWFKEQAAELVALAVPPIAPASCRVRYQVHGQWPRGFNTQVTVENLSSTPIKGWTLQWAFAENETIEHSWGVTASQKRAVVTARSLSWNSTIRAGQSQTFGFIGRQDDAVHLPSLLFLLNGAPCSMRE